MRCKDCEEIAKTLNNDGLCEFCAKRKALARYRKTEYKALKDIKGTRGYKIAMTKRRKIKEQRRESDVSEIENSTSKTENLKKNTTRDKYYLQVSDDIEKSFEEANLTKTYLNVDLENFIEMFYSLMQEDNYIADARKAEEIFNKTSIDLLHAIENSTWEDKEIQDIVYQEKALLELRRPTKTIICYYKMLEPVIEYLKGDTYFMELLDSLRINFIRNKDKIEKAEYFPRQTHLMAKEKQKNYNCSVMCYNLYGKQTLEELKANGGIWAKDENEAKRVFLRFINSSFPTITYNSDDIKIELNQEL